MFSKYILKNKALKKYLQGFIRVSSYDFIIILIINFIFLSIYIKLDRANWVLGSAEALSYLKNFKANFTNSFKQSITLINLL